ncbi:MAG: mechanosensitive ion channel [Hyphomicrobiales bacterium]|nr:mechanosensitive ion channel [Hyphomicrobiales bacterium]
MNLANILGSVELFTQRLEVWAAEAIPHFVGAILVLVIGLWFARFARRSVLRLIARGDLVDETLLSVISSTLYYAIVLLVIVAFLSQLGIQTTSILAALGAAGLAIGLALQGTLANVAAGIMLLWLRPFELGDYIDADGIAGTVNKIGLFSTELHSWDGVFQFVPNSELWNTRVTNYSRLPTRLLELKFGIAYDDDMRTAKETLRNIVIADERVLDDPEPQILTYELGDSAVVLAVRCWTKTPDYWAARWALTDEGKQKLEAAGISIPFPQRDVHIVDAPQQRNEVAA